MEDINQLRNIIQELEKIHHLHILKIICDNKVSYTENTNGIFINLSTTPSLVLSKIKEYLNYVKLQQYHLDKGEATKEQYKQNLFKETELHICSNTSNE
jgi:hypothetical protein